VDRIRFDIVCVSIRCRLLDDYVGSISRISDKATTGSRVTLPDRGLLPTVQLAIARTQLGRPAALMTFWSTI
jgi:hypothetical protein